MKIIEERKLTTHLFTVYFKSAILDLVYAYSARKRSRPFKRLRFKPPVYNFKISHAKAFQH